MKYYFYDLFMLWSRLRFPLKIKFTWQGKWKMPKLFLLLLILPVWKLVIVDPVSVGQWPYSPCLLCWKFLQRGNPKTPRSDILNHPNCLLTCNVWIVKIKQGGNPTYPGISFIWIWRKWFIDAQPERPCLENTAQYCVIKHWKQSAWEK